MSQAVRRDPARGGQAGSVVVTVEHAGRRVPPRWASLFEPEEARALLASHRGWDPGAQDIGRELGRALSVRPRSHHVTRLIVDVNRSLHHPRCFSGLTRLLPVEERERIVSGLYLPHRSAVEADVRRVIDRDGRCVHIGVHTFTPALRGEVRNADVGILYDPARPGERALARAWRAALRAAIPRARVRLNYPYRGAADGLTTTLRRRLGGDVYFGMELEVNQGIPGCPGGRAILRRVVEALARQLLDGVCRAAPESL